MALKFRITKAAHDKLDETLQEHYEPTADGKHYELDVAGLPEDDADSGALKRANDRLKEEKANLREELDEAQATIKDFEKNQTSGDKDIAKVNARWERKLKDAEDAGKATVGTLLKQIGDGLIDTTALSLAQKISTSPPIMVDHIKKRMEVVFDADNKPTLKFKGADGKVSDALKLDDIEKEFVANKDFAAIIIGSKARGSGAPPSGVPLNPGSAGSEQKPVILANADRGTLVESIRAKVAEKRQAAGA